MMIGMGMYKMHSETRNKILCLEGRVAIRVGTVKGRRRESRRAVGIIGRSRAVECRLGRAGRSRAVTTGKDTVLPESLGPTDLAPLREERNDSYLEDVLQSLSDSESDSQTRARS